MGTSLITHSQRKRAASGVCTFIHKNSEIESWPTIRRAICVGQEVGCATMAAAAATETSIQVNIEDDSGV